MVYSEKWLRNHPKIYITFSDTYVLMLCRKFELIPTSILQVTPILRKRQSFQKIPKAILNTNNT